MQPRPGQVELRTRDLIASLMHHHVTHDDGYSDKSMVYSPMVLRCGEGIKFQCYEPLSITARAK